MAFKFCPILNPFESTVERLNAKGKTFAVDGVCIFFITIEACFGIVKFNLDTI